jgi:hypothetical protein
VFENRVLRTFGPKRDKVTGEWRKLHNEELNDLYPSPNKIDKNENEMGRANSEYGVRRGVYKVLVSKSEKRHHLGDPD